MELPALRTNLHELISRPRRNPPTPTSMQAFGLQSYEVSICFDFLAQLNRSHLELRVKITQSA